MHRLLFLTATLLTSQPGTGDRYFAIKVVDEETGRGVPLVELRTVNDIRLWTDSNGVVAFDELMGKDVFFHIKSHGYEFPADGFGIRGKTLHVTAGGSAKLSIRRINIAERLYRVTGGGIYRDSVLVGAKVPIKEPLLNGLVLGSDSVVNAVYRGKIYWFWGDTNRPSYPLGNFQVPGATSELPDRGGLDPDAGVDLRYFLDGKGFAKETARMPGKGPTWLTALVVLTDETGRDRLYSSYLKIEPPLKISGRGLAVFDDAKEQFEHLAAVDVKAPLFPAGHAMRHRECDVERVYFAHPFPAVRVRSTAADFLRTDAYEAFTPLKTGTRVEDGQVDRDEAGQLRYAWRKGTPALEPADEAKLIAAGKLKRGEARWQLRDRDTGKAVVAHRGSVYWNAFRKRWVMIAVQSAGTSYLGEVWYAEADTPVGPWAFAVKVATHERYSFYNPRQHPMFDKDDGRLIYFEGTYTHTFSGNTDATPRYDYNQVMYRLDLADPRLVMPVAFYNRKGGVVPERFAAGSEASDPGKPAFFAADRPFMGSVPVLAVKDGMRLGKPGDPALFCAVPPDRPKSPAALVPLFEYRERQGAGRIYSTDAKVSPGGYDRIEQPICLVWSIAE